MGKVSNVFKSIISAVVKIVKVIVKVVKFIVKAIVNFVKGVFSGDIASIVMLVAIIFTFGAALGWFAPLLQIQMSTAIISSSFTVLGSEYQRQKAAKMQKQAEQDLERQSDAARANLEAQAKAEEEKLQDHFNKMEGDRYKGFESGQFGIGSFEPDGVLPDQPSIKKESSVSSNLGLLAVGLVLGSSVIYGLSDGGNNNG